MVDQNGRKMSKSIGNVVAPQEVYNEFGADILRLWAAATDYSGELAISKEILKRVRKLPPHPQHAQLPVCQPQRLQPD